MHQTCKVFDEVAVVAHQSTKHSYFSVSLWHGKLYDGIHILLTWANSFAGDMMCKVHYLCLEEGALGWFELQIEFSEAFKYYS